MLLHKKLLTWVSFLTIGISTNSYGMTEDLSLYGEEVWEGAPPSTLQVQMNVENWTEPLKAKPGTLRINEGGFTSFVLEDQRRKKQKVIEPNITKSKGTVVFYFFDQDEDPRSEFLEPIKSKMASEDKVKIKFDTSKKRKTADVVVAKRKKAPISTHSKKSVPKRQKVMAPKGKPRAAANKH